MTVLTGSLQTQSRRFCLLLHPDTRRAQHYLLRQAPTLPVGQISQFLASSHTCMVGLGTSAPGRPLQGCSTPPGTKLLTQTLSKEFGPGQAESGQPEDPGEDGQ